MTISKKADVKTDLVCRNILGKIHQNISNSLDILTRVPSPLLETKEYLLRLSEIREMSHQTNNQRFISFIEDMEALAVTSLMDSSITHKSLDQLINYKQIALTWVEAMEMGLDFEPD